MKKLALILSLISFVCFVAVSGAHAQNPKATKETKVEQKATTSEKGTAAGCAHGEKDAKCAKGGEKDHKCAEACKSGEKKGCCPDKKGCAKDSKGCSKDKKGEKELK